MKCVLTVAPGATEITSGEPYEDTGQSRICRLALQRFVDFGDLHEKQLPDILANHHLSSCGQSRSAVDNGFRSYQAEPHLIKNLDGLRLGTLLAFANLLRRVISHCRSGPHASR